MIVNDFLKNPTVYVLSKTIKVLNKQGYKSLFMDCITQHDKEYEILLPPDTTV
jgi:hypothetical protein